MDSQANRFLNPAYVHTPCPALKRDGRAQMGKLPLGEYQAPSWDQRNRQTDHGAQGTPPRLLKQHLQRLLEMISGSCGARVSRRGQGGRNLDRAGGAQQE